MPVQGQHGAHNNFGAKAPEKRFPIRIKPGFHSVILRHEIKRSEGAEIFVFQNDGLSAWAKLG